jgi:8-oxo-dGTP pyrophosphatase MutT (NUDIX family)
MSGEGAQPQYAALPWRRNNGVEILLITSRQTKRWVIPKGWPMADLAPHESAALEAFEEAGVDGNVVRSPLGHYDYLKRLKDGTDVAVRVDVFALEVIKRHETWPEQGERTARWFPAEAAAQAVGEPELAALIREFSKVHAGRGT